MKLNVKTDQTLLTLSWFAYAIFLILALIRPLGEMIDPWEIIRMIFAGGYILLVSHCYSGARSPLPIFLTIVSIFAIVILTIVIAVTALEVQLVPHELMIKVMLTYFVLYTGLRIGFYNA